MKIIFKRFVHIFYNFLIKKILCTFMYFSHIIYVFNHTKRERKIEKLWRVYKLKEITCLRGAIMYSMDISFHYLNLYCWVVWKDVNLELRIFCLSDISLTDVFTHDAYCYYCQNFYIHYMHEYIICAHDYVERYIFSI